MSTINQLRKTFQKNMYQTPVNNKKKFKRKIYNEDVYQGGMENEIPNGYSILKDKTSKEIYKGDWKNGQYDGSGVLINRNTQPNGKEIYHQDLSQIIQQNQWVKYEGDMKSNEIQGFGTIYFHDNLKFVGNFIKVLLKDKDLFKAMVEMLLQLYGKKEKQLKFYGIDILRIQNRLFVNIYQLIN